jgi:flavodoxin I
MNATVVYDSTYGNTEKIAKAIGEAIGGDARVVRLTESGASELDKAELLVAASPTTGGRPSEAMLRFLNSIPAGSLKNVNVGAVDTRLKAKWVKIFGYAAEKIAKRLADCGGTLAAPPEGFFVRAAKGPLLDGELERAAAWAKGIAAIHGGSSTKPPR